MGAFKNMLEKKLEEERKNKLAQQTAPVSFATGERVDADFAARHPFAAQIYQKTASTPPVVKTPAQIKKTQIPYTVDQSDYDTYKQRVEDLKTGGEKTIEAAKPSTAKTLDELQEKRGAMGIEGTGLLSFAGGTNQKQSPIDQAMAKLIDLYSKVNQKKTTLNKYARDVDYELGENVDGYEDWKRVYEEQTGTDEKRTAASFGTQRRDKGAEEITARAIQAATDMQLTAMLDKTTTAPERALIQAEIDRRQTEKQQPKDDAIYSLLNEQQRADIGLRQQYGAEITGFDYMFALQDEAANLRRQVAGGRLDDQQQEEAERRIQQIEDGIEAFMTEEPETFGPEQMAPEVQQYNEWMEKGENETYAQRYTEEAAAEKDAWDDVYNGTYTGDDAEKRAHVEKYEQLEEEFNAAQLAYMQGIDPEDGHTLTEEERATVLQRANELYEQMEALDAQAKEARTAAAEKAGSVSEALYGEGSLLRFAGASAWEGATKFASGFYGALDLVFGKPATAVGQLITGDKDWKSTLTRQNEKYKELIANPATEEATAATNAMGGGEGWEIARQTIGGMIENIPNTLMAMLSGGASAAAGMAGAQAAAVEGMASVGQGATSRVIQGLLTDYNYWTSFMQEIEGDYEEAAQKTNNPVIASLYAMLSTLINAGIEIGGEGDSGIQGIGKEREGGIAGAAIQAVTGRDIPLLESILDSAADEATEELKQGLVSGLAKKALLDHNVQWVSTDGSDAVLNLQETGESMLVGGLTGGLLAGTTEPIARATQTRAQNREAGQHILDNDWGEALGGIAEETAGIRDETTKALREGTADLSKPKTLRQVGKLMQATMEKLDEKSRAYFENTMERSIAASMRKNGYEGDVTSDAHILAVAYGEGRDALTMAEKERLETPEMRELYRAMTGNEDFTAEYAPGSTRDSKKAAEALAAVQGMLSQSRESVSQAEAEEAARAGSKLAEAAQISADGKLHIKHIVDDTDTRESAGADTPELVGVTVTDGDIQVKVKTGDEIENVPFEQVEFPDRDTAERAAISAAVGNEELANTIFNAKAPGGMPFKEFAKKFNEVYLAASAGINSELIRRSGIADGLQNVEVSTAVEMGQKAQFTDRVKRLAREKALSLARGIFNGIVPDADIDTAAEATLKSIAGEELTEEEAAIIGKYDAVMEVVENATEENTQAYGGDTAYQYGLSGRSLDELAATIRDAGGEMTDAVHAEYERGAAELAERETRRIAHINNLNRGADGTRKGVLRSISAEEAEANGVNTISRALTSKQRAAVTALRGFAESTGVNMVLFESTTEEGTHTGKEGWYDPKTQTVYLDVFAGYGNEQAILRTAAHELTHFIQSWSPAQYKRLRTFLLGYYYGEGQDAVKGLVQEQLEKNATLSEAEAMDEVIADASETMMGDGDAVKAMAEEHPRLFAKVKGWLDNWSKAITKAWRGITGAHSRAATMLQKSAEAFKNYQRMWYEALEDASVNLRGEVRTEQITENLENKLLKMRETNQRWKQEFENRRQEALDRAQAARDAEEARRAIEEAQAAQEQQKALEEQQKRQEAEAREQAQKEKALADKITATGKMLEKRLGRLSAEARAFVEQFAAEHAIALDGTMETAISAVNTALHYFNQGKAGIAFDPSRFKKEAFAAFSEDFRRALNEYGQRTREQNALETVAEEETPPAAEETPAATPEETMDTTPEEVPEATETEVPQEENTETPAEAEEATEPTAPEVETQPEETPATENEAQEDGTPAVTLEEVAGETEAAPEAAEEGTENAIPEADNAAEDADNAAAETNNTTEEANNTTTETEAEEETTPEAVQAAENHAQAIERMTDILKGIPKRARDLVMKWAANEYVNVNTEDGSLDGARFAKFALKWYNAGKEGIRTIDVPFVDGQDTEYPPFLQDTFYNEGKRAAETAKKRAIRKGTKQNENAADEGTNKLPARDGAGTGRVLAEVSAENVPADGGEGDAVPDAERARGTDGTDDGGSDGGRSVRERGEGVRERDHVRPAAGEVETETETAEEERTPQEQLEDEVEAEKEREEADTPRGTNHVIGETLDLPKGEKARFKANLDAISLMKRLETEGRFATAEERAILARYVGWGGLSQAFDENNQNWKREYKQLLGALTPDEYAAARASTLNAHYTSLDVIRAMYDGLNHLGFNGGRMLEPSGGIGHFIGAMPAAMQQKVRGWTLVELDSVTGRIAKQLYPNADVRVQGFEEARIGNDLVDVAIGNVPFGNFAINDPTYPKTVTSAIHNYFFAKAIDKVRPGGLLMFITSRYTMDAQGVTMREYMQERADLLGAIRLPDTAFKGNAGTEVVTDILVFKKREAGTAHHGANFLRLQYTPISQGKWEYVNEYFATHPEMVLGTPEMTGTMYSKNQLTYKPLPGDLGTQIRAAFEKMDGRMDYTAVMPSVEELRQRAAEARKNTKENGFEVRGGKLYKNVGGQLQTVDMAEKDAAKVRSMLEIRDTARELQEMQKRGATAKEIKAQRDTLNRLYDDFVKQNGYLHDKRNARLMDSDPDRFFILALEDYDKKARSATKAAIFERNTIAKEVTVTHAETPQDAMAVTLNERGYINLDRVAELLGVSNDQARDMLLDTGLAFLKTDGTLETRENYLSGNVRAKLREAEALATVDPRYQRNVDELKKVIPENVGRESIYVQPGATWIPDAVYEQFICETLRTWNGYRRNVTVKYIPSSGEYTLDLSTAAKRDYRNTQEWGTPDKTFTDIFESLLNNREISVYRKTEDGGRVLDSDATQAAREKAEKIQKRFSEWLWADEKRAGSLEELYNERYNAIVTPDYDGSALTIAGANADKQLRPHQKNVVHRIVQGGGNTLIAHCVGAGKTAEMAGAAMKLRQLGIVQKPVFVVPKALVSQWGREFLDFFPAAKILVLSENDFNAKNRKEFANRIATGDYDAVIMSREQYSHIPMTPEYEKAFYQDTIDQITAAVEEEKRNNGQKASSVKNMEKAKKRLEVKLKKLETKARDADNIYFEDMGIDSIFVDEAHEYKNLFFTSNMNNISGLGNRDGSQRAFDMYMKTKYLRGLNGGRGIVFATATPVMNSMSEMYIMQKYLQEDTLERLGIHSFDAWANLFGEVMTVVEPTPSGKGFRQKQAFARFKNLPELQRLFRSFADVKTSVEGLKVPKMRGGKRITVECEPGQFQLDYIDQLAERADRLKKGHVDPKEDNMLKITSEGRKLSYTQRMIDPSLPYEDGCKLIACVQRVAEEYKASKKIKGTQMIFCDMATPKGSSNVEVDANVEAGEDTESVDFYADIKRMLIKRGIPAAEIAFIHDADTNEKKLKLQDDVNEGRVRVLIGSTAKMGVGLNAQKRIVAMHHLDAPWRPGDIEQREGRALRQGNMNEEVAMYVYVTKRTFDTRMWDNLYRKASFINQIMNGTNTAREVEGDGDFALSAAEIKAIATGDPMIVEQFEVANQIKLLEGLEREYNREKKLAREKIRTNETYIEAYKAQRPKVLADQKTAAAALDKEFVMKVDGKRYESRAKATAPLFEAAMKHEGILSEKKIGEFGGFTLLADGKGSIVIKGAGTYSVNINPDSDTGTMSRVMNKISDLQENLDNIDKAIRNMEQENASLQQKLDAPFEKAEELEKLRARAQEIADALNPVEDQAGAEALTDEEEKVKYSLRPDVPLTDEDYQNNQKEVLTMQPVKALRGDEFKMDTGTLRNDVLKFYGDQYDGKVQVPIIGETTLDKRGMYRSLAHGMTPIKAAAYAAVPDVLVNGKIIDYQRGWKGKQRDTITIAAPITIGSDKYLMGVIVDRPHLSTAQRYYTHDAVAFEIIKMGQPVQQTVDVQAKDGRMSQSAQQTANVQAKDGGMLGGYPTIQRLLQKILGVNTQNSDRDVDTLSDRQLLARAYEGIAKTATEREALERYKKRIAQLDADTEQMQKLSREIHDKTFVPGMVDRAAAKTLQRQYNELSRKVAQADKILLNMERSAALKRVLEVERREAVRKNTEKIRGQITRYNQAVEKREYEMRIKKVSERLAKWLTQPDKTNHVPKAMQTSIARFLLSIQQGTRTEFRGKGGAKRERNFVQSLRELQGIVSDINAYQTMDADERVEHDFGMYMDMPDGFAEQMADLIRSVEKTMGDAGTAFNVDAMTGEQLKTLYQVLSTISASVTQANDLLALNSFQHVSEAAQNSVKYIRSQGKVQYWRGGQVHNFLNWENLQPVRAFERFGEGGEAIFKGLQRGQAQMAFNVQRVLDLTEGVYTSKEARAWSNEIKTFHVGGKQVSMPVADVMSMYCLMKRAQAVGHILGEGFRVADFKDNRGRLIAGSGTSITEEEAKAIIGSLTPRQRAVADRLQEIMSTVGSEWGNYVSMKRFGYDMFTEKNYFPIEVDSDRLTAKTDESRGNELYRLLNLSSVKPITRGARNRLMIKNIFDVYASHMSDMAQYNAMGLPVLDAVKWINYRSAVERDDHSIATDGVRDAAREMYGNKSQRYIIELLKDVNGTQAIGEIGEQISKKMLMRFNRQAVAANLSVALKQPTSIVRAATELGGFDLIRGALGNKGMFRQNREEMLKYSGIAVWKDLGFYDVNVSRPVKQMIMHTDSAVDKLLEKTTWAAEKADEITWAAMWGACKAYVQRSGEKFANTEEFMQAVADKFEDVIYKTQVVDSILTRSQFMRGTSFMSKSFASFMSEPTTTYNMLLEAWNRFTNDLRRGKSFGQAFMTHKNIIVHTTMVYLTSATLMTILEALIGAWRDDDDYETFMEKFKAGLLDNAIDEILPFNLLPVVSDIYDYAKKAVGGLLPDEWGVGSFAGGSSAVYSAADQAMDLIEIIQKYMDGETKYTEYGLIYKGSKILSEAAGIPIAPAMREVVAIWNNIMPQIDPALRLETYESSYVQGAAALYKAITTGDKERETLVRRQLAANGVEDKKLQSALKSLIKADAEEGAITEADAAKYLAGMVGMEANDAYFKVQEWDYEASTGEDYGRFVKLEEAIIKGTGVEAAKRELTQHGYSEDDVQTKIRSIISEQTAKKGMSATKAQALLQKYGGMDENQAWIRTQELEYQRKTGTSTSADTAMVIYAIDNKQSPKAAIDGLLAHGKEKSSIASSITSKYKTQYLELLKTSPAKAAELKGRLITVFDYLGYKGQQKVEDWEKPKKTK